MSFGFPSASRATVLKAKSSIARCGGTLGLDQPELNKPFVLLPIITLSTDDTNIPGCAAFCCASNSCAILTAAS